MRRGLFLKVSGSGFGQAGTWMTGKKENSLLKINTTLSGHLRL